MDWSRERWVKLYRNRTPQWMKGVSLGARGLFYELMRAVDMAGRLPLGKDHVGGVAWAVQANPRTVKPALEELIKDRCVVITGDVLTIRNFNAAQTAKTDDAVRKAMEREREEDLAKAREALESDGEHVESAAERVESDDSRRVADVENKESAPKSSTISDPACHAMSRDVTIRGEESRGEEKRKDLSDSESAIQKSEGAQGALDFTAPPAPALCSRGCGKPAGHSGRCPKPKADAGPMPFTVAEACDELRAGGGVIVDPFPPGAKYPVKLTALIRDYPDRTEWRRLSEWLAAGGDGYGKSGWRDGGGKRADLDALIARFGGWYQQAMQWRGPGADSDDGYSPLSKSAIEALARMRAQPIELNETIDGIAGQYLTEWLYQQELLAQRNAPEMN